MVSYALVVEWVEHADHGIHVLSFWLATGAHGTVYLKGPLNGILLFCSLGENVDVTFFSAGEVKKICSWQDQIRQIKKKKLQNFVVKEEARALKIPNASYGT